MSFKIPSVGFRLKFHKDIGHKFIVWMVTSFGVNTVEESTNYSLVKLILLGISMQSIVDLV